MSLIKADDGTFILAINPACIAEVVMEGGEDDGATYPAAVIGSLEELRSVARLFEMAIGREAMIKADARAKHPSVKGGLMIPPNGFTF